MTQWPYIKLALELSSVSKKRVHITTCHSLNSRWQVCLYYCCKTMLSNNCLYLAKKVQVGKDQEKAQSEKDSHSKNRGGKKPN